ncbi:MAG: VF530 family protein [Crocinitomicaceae bacterium]|nr:VF530 family protein [Crocinitomicaceae bacterium]MDG1777272.1 VF530 family protein [Crocinitomicaceae bacterium]
MTEQPKNPLHGKTLKSIVEELESEFGWDHMGYLVNINCFKNNPTLKSSLTFLRKTPWARTKVENLWVERIHQFSKDKK